MAIYKEFNPVTDKNVGLTEVTTNVSSSLPATLPGIAKGILFPPGYKRLDGGNVICTSSFFTFSTSSQKFDISYGIRPGCFDDADSMFYKSNTGWRNDSSSPGGFTAVGLDAFTTSSMIYASTAEYLNDGEDFLLDSNKIDLLGILNFKRSSYKEELKPGTFTLTTQASGAMNGTPSVTKQYTVSTPTRGEIKPSGVGTYGDIKTSDGTIVGGLYYDYAIAIFDIFKLFFPSSTDRLVSNRSQLMSFLTGSPANTAKPAPNTGGEVDVKHGVAFFSGSKDNDLPIKKTKYFAPRSPSNNRAFDLLNFYSGSYSQSLSSFAMELGGVSVQSRVNFQSSLFYCRATKDEFNYSQNPTAGTGSGDNRVSYRMTAPTTYITSVGLFTDDDQLLAVGKLSQPFKKDFATEMNLRVRLDF